MQTLHPARVLRQVVCDAGSPHFSGTVNLISRRVLIVLLAEADALGTLTLPMSERYLSDLAGIGKKQARNQLRLLRSRGLISLASGSADPRLCHRRSTMVTVEATALLALCPPACPLCAIECQKEPNSSPRHTTIPAEDLVRSGTQSFWLADAFQRGGSVGIAGEPVLALLAGSPEPLCTDAILRATGLPLRSFRRVVGRLLRLGWVVILKEGRRRRYAASLPPGVAAPGETWGRRALRHESDRKRWKLTQVKACGIYGCKKGGDAHGVERRSDDAGWRRPRGGTGAADQRGGGSRARTTRGVEGKSDASGPSGILRMFDLRGPRGTAGGVPVPHGHSDPAS